MAEDSKMLMSPVGSQMMSQERANALQAILAKMMPGLFGQAQQGAMQSVQAPAAPGEEYKYASMLSGGRAAARAKF